MKKKRKIPESTESKTHPAWDMQPQRLQNGYDLVHQAGVINGRYTRCGNPDPDCTCYGCTNEGKLPGLDVQLVNRRA
jgi:hypothetical protein